MAKSRERSNSNHHHIAGLIAVVVVLAGFGVLYFYLGDQENFSSVGHVFEYANSGSGAMIPSTSNPRLFLNAIGKHLAVVRLHSQCSVTNSNCLWKQLPDGRIQIQRNQELYLNAYGGAKEGGNVRLFRNCPSTNSDCTWNLLSDGRIQSRKNTNLYLKTANSAQFDQVFLSSECSGSNIVRCQWNHQEISSTSPSCPSYTFIGCIGSSTECDVTPRIGDISLSLGQGNSERVALPPHLAPLNTFVHIEANIPGSLFSRGNNLVTSLAQIDVISSNNVIGSKIISADNLMRPSSVIAPGLRCTVPTDTKVYLGNFTTGVNPSQSFTVRMTIGQQSVDQVYTFSNSHPLIS